MLSFAEVTIIGGATRDPEYVIGANDVKIGRFSVGVNRQGKKDVSDYINCVAFGNTAEYVSKYLKKGRRVLIKGRLQSDTYTNKEGRKVTSYTVVVDKIDFLDNKYVNPENEQQQEETASVPAQEDGFMNVPEGMEEELPFA